MNTHAYTPMHIQDLINRTAMEANILPLTSRCDSACIFCSVFHKHLSASQRTDIS